MPREVKTTWDQYTANDRIACVFSPDECAKIVDTYSVTGWVDSRHRNVTDRDPATLPRWISSDDPTAGWIFNRIERHVLQWNDRWFNFQIDLCIDANLRCHLPGDVEEWHTDLGTHGFSRRKLSTIVVLSRPETYAGGTIEFFEQEFGTRSFKMKAGDVAIFASWLHYRVLPVTEGRLWTLTTWWSGNRPMR